MVRRSSAAQLLLLGVLALATSVASAAALCKNQFAGLPTVIYNKTPYLLTADSLGDVWCRGSGFFKAGAVRVAPLENIRAPISAFDPTTGAVCDQYNCTVIVGLECMQEGQKRCKADAFGNVGRNNSGYNNFGDYNTGYNNIGTFIYGSGNWGIGVAGVASIGVNETGVYNKLSSAWDLVSPLTVNLDESAPAPAPADIPAPGPADVPAPVYAPEPETYVPEPDYAPSPY